MVGNGESAERVGGPSQAPQPAVPAPPSPRDQTAPLLPLGPLHKPLPSLDEGPPLSVGLRQESVGLEQGEGAEGAAPRPASRCRHRPEGSGAARRGGRASGPAASPGGAAPPAPPARTPGAAARALTSPGDWESGARSPGEGGGWQVAGAGRLHRPRGAQVSRAGPAGGEVAAGPPPRGASARPLLSGVAVP